jgi:alkanesulfonate monooxygenase SsuD/methylene tetrahydromethanopterin reductase-like flavin-dependent oxidoreductase (luciferase family)
MRYGFTLPGRGPLATPDTLAAYAERAGRDPAEIDIIYRTHDYRLLTEDRAAAASTGARRPFVGTADSIAADIRRYEEMGVGYLVMDFARLGRNLDEVLEHMEALAAQVWPQV